MSYDPLDEDFPLGDGPADLTALVQCPYCFEELELALDPGGGPAQDYVEDCSVCCRPLSLSVAYLEDGSAQVEARTLDD